MCLLPGFAVCKSEARVADKARFREGGKGLQIACWVPYMLG